MFKDSQIGVVTTPAGSFNYIGNIDLLQSKCISVAGTRQPSKTSIQWLKHMLSCISNHSIVSGLALGSDSVAHYTAIKLGLPTIAVLPSGLQNIAPRSNEKLARKIVANNGLLLSAYNNESGPSRETYIARNKVIAEMSHMLIVPECSRFSGTMHTVEFAHKANKTIVVQSAKYSGNQYIINHLGGLAK